MDKKVLDFLRETLTPDQSQLLSIAERLADCCDNDPAMPSGSIRFLNTLCYHFPMLIKRGDVPPEANPSGDPLPTKEDLNRVLLSSFLPHPESEEQREEEEERLARANKRKAYLINIKKCLERQIVELTAEKANLELQKEQATDRTNKAMAVLAVQTEKFNEMASSLITLVEKLNKRIDPDSDEPPLFFCQLSMDSFFEAQDEYTEQLNKFCKNAFSRDLKELSELTPEAAAVLLSGGRPGQDANIDPKILQIQSMKSLGLMKRMRLELELSKMKSNKDCLRVWREKFDKLRQGDETAAEDLIISTQEELQQNENKFREESKDIPRQVEEIAMSEIADILEGEMNHRLAQQKEMVNRQEELLEYLRHQKTIYLIVTNIYDAEKRKMAELLQCLKTVKSILDEASETARLLEEHSKEAKESETGGTEGTPRLIIPSSDRSLNRLYKLMGLENKSRFPTYEVLREAISNLQFKMGVAEQRAECLQKSNLALVLHTEQKLRTATDTMKEFEQQAGELVEGPEGRHHLEKRLQEFERKMKEVLQTVNSHKQELIQHPTLALERRMAAVYHTDPQLYIQLKHKLDAIKQNM